MATGIQRSNTLEPPRPSVELEDPGAHDLDTSGDEDHFLDASEGGNRASLDPQSQSSRTASPVPRTRVQRVDDQPRHGEVPGLPAYDMRKQDAVPDELEIVPDDSGSEPGVSSNLERTASPGGTPVPLMVVEKIDPEAPSHGEVPGTAAYEQRLADATPDLVFKSSDPNMPRSLSPSTSASAPRSAPIPETIVTGIDASPGSVQQPGEGSPKFDRSSSLVTSSLWRCLDPVDSVAVDSGPSDEFEEFEDRAAAGEDDDFGDFDDGFGGPIPSEPGSDQLPFSGQVQSPLSPPLLDFDAVSSLPDISAAIQAQLDTIFPKTTDESLAALPTPESILADSPIFPTERSRALWKQLITPPPLQPPNWTKSRIRRLFLVSLGVPVDLDEILPPSKQKKLVLPDMHLDSATRRSESDRTYGSVSALKTKAMNDSSASLDSVGSGSRSRRRHRGPPPPPDLDLGAVKRLCATTDEKLRGLTDVELDEHVRELQSMTGKTQELLVYWLKRRDGVLKEKEAFEGVIENLVRHARRVRS